MIENITLRFATPEEIEKKVRETLSIMDQENLEQEPKEDSGTVAINVLQEIALDITESVENRIEACKLLLTYI